MLSTQQVIRALQAANSGVVVNEDRIRHAVRRGRVAPKSFAGRLAWTHDDVVELAEYLGIAPPAHEDVPAPSLTAR